MDQFLKPEISINYSDDIKIFQLYEDSRACVLTKEYLEAEERELEEDFVIPVTIICLIGGLGKILQIALSGDPSPFLGNDPLDGRFNLKPQLDKKRHKEYHNRDYALKLRIYDKNYHN